MSTAMDQSTAAARNRKPLQTTTEPTATSTASQVQEKRIREASKSSLIPGRRKKRSTSSDDEEGEELPKKYRQPYIQEISKTKDATIAFILFLVAAAVRFWNIGTPDQVVFDEVHFGKFASYYLRREIVAYYFDVHPPLAKLLNAFAGYLAGFPGHFDFENIGDSYITNNVPYIKMRSLPALMGSACIPLIYLMSRESGTGPLIGILTASLLAFDNAHIAQDRLILLDAALILFMMLSLYSYIKFYQQRYRSFSKSWWFWMVSTGVNLALTMSCKMVGLFTFATIGISVLFDLWNIIDHKRGHSLSYIYKHFFARVFALIILPAFVYLFWFWVHFSILIKSGTGDSFMSSKFQHTLEGSPMLTLAKDIHYYDKITLQHKGTDVYLHSHLDKYPLKYDDGRISSQGQQVTGYPFNDTNNVWQLIPTVPLPEVTEEQSLDPDFPTNLDRKEFKIRHKHIIRLLHVNTDTYLLAHDVASPLMATNEEFTTTPSNNTEKYKDSLFELMIENEKDTSQKVWQSKATKIRLIHKETRVSMWTHPEPLPDWGFKQQEINGNKNVQEKTALWTVDDLYVDETAPDFAERSKPAEPRKKTKMNFFSKFMELQLQMLNQNAHLTQSHPYASSPINWPFLMTGISFWTSDEPKRQIYFIGNVFTWWPTILSISLWTGIMSMIAIMKRRGLKPISEILRKRLLNNTGFFIVAWACHYFPFFLMSRQLFLHHYLPAHVCSCLVFGQMFNFFLTDSVIHPATKAGKELIKERMSRKRTGNVVEQPVKIAALVFISLVIGGYWFWAPLTYGHIELAPKEVLKRKLLATWTLHHEK